MNEEWRLLDTSYNNAYYNMALDEAIVKARSDDLVPNTLRYFRWKPSAVSIGYFQSMEDEVDLEACNSKGVDYVRRRTGGGAVYHDLSGELTYSIIIEENHRLISKDFLQTYRILCQGLVKGLSILGIKAKFEPINDIVVDGKKISGNAQTRGAKIVHQHGTILRKVDPSIMFTVLKVSDEKVRDKLITSVEERVTSINRVLKRQVDFKELKTALTKGFEEALRISLVPSEISEFEKKLTSRLEREKYRTKEWLFKR